MLFFVAMLFWNSPGHLLQKTTPELCYFDLRYVFWGHNDSVGRGSAVSRFLMVKSSEMILFFYLHFTWLCGHEIIKEFLKNINFWKYDNCFSSELSKLTSVRNKLNLPLKYWFMEAKIDFCVCHGPPKWSKYHLDT